MRRILFVLFVVLLACAPTSLPALGAETVRLPVTRDLWISSASGEEEASNGAVPRLKVKGYQELSILDFDVEPLRGKKIRRATLAVKLSSDVKLNRVSIGTISEEWTEGNGANYDKTPGASSFRWRANPDEPWLQPHALNPLADDAYRDITSVTLGEGGSFWSSAKATEPRDGWQFVDVAPDVVAARVLGVSKGFVFFDDSGTELERKANNDVEFHSYPNRFFYSREQNRASEPYLEVEFEDPDASELAASPASPENLAVETNDLPQGAAMIRWTQRLRVNDRLVAFDVSIDGEQVPRYLVPAPIQDANVIKAKSERFETLLAGLDVKSEHTVEIRALNRFGVQSAPATLRFRPQTRKRSTWSELVGKVGDGEVAKSDQPKSLRSAKLGQTEIAILDPFVKLTQSGDFVVDNLPKDYWNRNALWNAEKREINLASARNEFIGFQIAFKGDAKKVQVKIRWENEKDAPECRIHRFARVNSPIGSVVDPVLAVSDPEKAIELAAPNDSLYCEIFTPSKTKSGKRNGVLEIIDDEKNSFRAKIELNVWNFEIPNELSFLPEMNCYSLPENERDYYRMAQLHRTFIDRVPYSHRGTVGDGLAPEWNAEKQTFDWTKWERRFGDYFTGEAFADLPRGAVPIEAFYLPIFENYPANIFEGLLDDEAWATRLAFSDEYKKTLATGSQQFVEKIIDEKWNKTRFLFFLNNKSDYKRNGWLNASSPWLLDEPASTRDFLALAFFGDAFQKSIASAMKAKRENPSDYKILYRVDISRPQWERSFLDDSLGFYVVAGGAFKQYQKTVSDRVRRTGRTLILYGVTAAPHEDCAQPILWSLDAWTQGADGIVPWQTIGNADSWKNSDELALFYPGVTESNAKVVPSIRLKAYRRGEQDVEYLVLLARLLNRGREEVGLAARARLSLDQSVNLKQSEEDAGKNAYQAANLDELERFRREVGKKINAIYPD